MSNRSGVTLIETLVVLGIIALLVSLIIPAIQRTREALNKTVCANNLRQIALAAHHYHTDHGCFPPGYFGPSLINQTDPVLSINEGSWIGHLPLLLPYLEKDSLFKNIKDSFDLAHVPVLRWSWSSSTQTPHIANYIAGMSKIKWFVCPSSPSFDPHVGNYLHGGSVLGLHTYNNQSTITTSYWIGDYTLAGDFKFLGHTNYLGVAGCGTGTNTEFSRYQGVYTNRSRVSLSQIVTQDGSSNTLLYGDSAQTERFNISWMGGGALGTYFGLLRSSPNSFIAFNSFHLSCVQFSMADGSLKQLRNANTHLWSGKPSGNHPDWLALQQLAGWRDGQSLSNTTIVD